jgi:2-amino-4-hydroxy-6-hydroxymethyldihydropteridine diphosphokinase
MSTALIALGANIGDKKRFVDRAVHRLSEGGDIVICARSPYYRTEPWGVADQDWFVNACVKVETGLAPLALLERCLAVETALGRVRDRRWGPRTIDIDLLAYDNVAMQHERLELPHPRLSERAFVLVPLADIAPDWPLGPKTVQEVLAGVDASGVDRLPWPMPDLADAVEEDRR